MLDTRVRKASGDDDGCCAPAPTVGVVRFVGSMEASWVDVEVGEDTEVGSDDNEGFREVIEDVESMVIDLDNGYPLEMISSPPPDTVKPPPAPETPISPPCRYTLEFGDDVVVDEAEAEDVTGVWTGVVRASTETEEVAMDMEFVLEGNGME